MQHLSWKLVVTIVGCSLLIASPAAAQQQSEECRKSRASMACMNDIQPCLQKVLKNISSLPMALTSQSMKNVIDGGVVNAVGNSFGSASAVAQLFTSLFNPLSDMARGATNGAVSGDSSAVASNLVVGFLKILLKLSTDTNIRNDTNMIDTMNVVIPFLEDINQNLECVTLTMGGAQTFLLVPMHSSSSIVLFYLRNCFSLRDSSDWCKFFDLVVPFGLSRTIDLVPTVMDTAKMLESQASELFG